jgi:hypothetical protein
VHDDGERRTGPGEAFGVPSEPVQPSEALDQGVPGRRFAHEGVDVQVDPDLDGLGGHEDRGPVRRRAADAVPNAT